jgi:hypothetical protein
MRCSRAPTSSRFLPLSLPPSPCLPPPPPTHSPFLHPCLTLTFTLPSLLCLSHSLSTLMDLFHIIYLPTSIFLYLWSLCPPSPSVTSSSIVSPPSAQDGNEYEGTPLMLAVRSSPRRHAATTAAAAAAAAVLGRDSAAAVSSVQISLSLSPLEVPAVSSVPQISLSLSPSEVPAVSSVPQISLSLSPLEVPAVSSVPRARKPALSHGPRYTLHSPSQRLGRGGPRRWDRGRGERDRREIGGRRGSRVAAAHAGPTAARGHAGGPGGLGEGGGGGQRVRFWGEDTGAACHTARRAERRCVGDGVAGPCSSTRHGTTRGLPPAAQHV